MSQFVLFVLFFCFWIFDIFDIFPNSNFDLLAETKVNNETAIFFRKINPKFGKLRRQGRVFKQDQMLKLRGHKLDNFSNGLLSEKWLLLHWHHFEDSHEKKKFDKVDHVHEFCTCANFNQFVTYFPNNREIWFTKMAMKNIHDFHSFYFASTRLLFFSGFENRLETFWSSGMYFGSSMSRN